MVLNRCVIGLHLHFPRLLWLLREARRPIKRILQAPLREVLVGWTVGKADEMGSYRLIPYMFWKENTGFSEVLDMKMLFVHLTSSYLLLVVFQLLFCTLNIYEQN